MNDTPPKKTLVHGFESIDCRGAIYMLQTKGLIDTMVWIGNADNCTINIIDLFNAKVPLSDIQIPEKLYDNLYKKIQLFDTIYSRHYVLDGVINVSSRLNIFNILVKYLYGLIVKNNIELMLFSNIPHEGPDFLLYEMAQHMNIETILCTQSRFPNKFFVVRTIDDFGEFSTSMIINSVTMQETMETLKSFEGPFFDLPNSPLSLRKRIRMIKPRKPLETMRKLFQQGLRKGGKVNTSLSAAPAGRIENRPRPLAKAINIFFSLLIKCYATYEFCRYTSRLNRITSNSVDLTASYVYFPLHLQPELTTVPLGYEYFDQALALEELHALLPQGWKLYVKENPKQTEFMRDQFFFQRIEALGNLIVVPRDYDSRALIRSCKILATVTGTAGMEAVVQGRPVVVFGSAWYKKFPNVFTFSRNMDFLSLARTVPAEKQEIYRHLNMLQNMMGNGVVDSDYKVLVENYSAEHNCRLLFETIQRYMIHNNPVQAGWRE